MPRKKSTEKNNFLSVLKEAYAISRRALKEVYSTSVIYYFVTFIVALNVLFLYYYVLTRTTTWEVFWQSNVPIYNYLQILLSLANALGIGVVFSLLFYIIDKRKGKMGGSILDAVGSLVYSTAATGCPVCGALLLPTLGVAASLTALPLGGLEIKALTLLLLGYAIYDYSKNILGLCPVRKVRFITFKKGYIEFNFKKEALYDLKPVAILAVFILAIYLLPKLPRSLKVDFRRSSFASSSVGAASSAGSSLNIQADNLFAQINPKEGYEINATYGDLGPKMIKMGVIDLEKFKSVYDRAGQPLTQEQLEILTKGSNKKIKIDSQNAYFLLNFFWAAGLANRSRILTEGEITKYGKNQLGYFASTGGWTLAKGNAMDYYAKERLIPLTPQQEALVERVASNIYRPCCNNSTAFPDCNHGMALLGVLQLMAANGASEKEMYEAAKYFNAFWFPQSYYDLALYFKAKEGKEFKDVDPKVLLSRDYSSVSGWQSAKRWLQQNGVVKQAPRTGGGCGV